MSDPVRDQYEAYPYPARDPKDERRRLIAGSPSNLAEINHYVFAGRCDVSAPFRALIAGGGTGDAAVMLAQQLADAGGPSEVVYLDISRSTRAIAEARVTERGLGNVVFHTGSVLDLPTLGLGRFDYIDCCGVLHHLDDPVLALRTLAEALADDGGMGLMLYAPHGRTGVYPAQAILRTLGAGLSLEDRVPLARRLLDALPPTNWLRRNALIGDHHKSDAELVDLLLHARDRAYSVAETADLVTAAGLRLVALIEPARYEPATYLQDGALLRRVQALDWLQRAALAEDLAGNMKKHILYVVKADNAADTVARPLDGTVVPVLREYGGEALAKAVARDLVIKAELDGLPLRFSLPRLAPAILARIDGRTSLETIHGALREKDSSLTFADFKTQFDRLYQVMNGLNHLLLRTGPER